MIFEGILNDQFALDYVYRNLEKWFPRGGKKTLTKKNICRARNARAAAAATAAAAPGR